MKHAGIKRRRRSAFRRAAQSVRRLLASVPKRITAATIPDAVRRCRWIAVDLNASAFGLFFVSPSPERARLVPCFDSRLSRHFGGDEIHLGRQWRGDRAPHPQLDRAMLVDATTASPRSAAAFGNLAWTRADRAAGARHQRHRLSRPCRSRPMRPGRLPRIGDRARGRTRSTRSTRAAFRCSPPSPASVPATPAGSARSPSANSNA